MSKLVHCAACEAEARKSHVPAMEIFTEYELELLVEHKTVEEARKLGWSGTVKFDGNIGTEVWYCQKHKPSPAIVQITDEKTDDFISAWKQSPLFRELL